MQLAAAWGSWLTYAEALHHQKEALSSAILRMQNQDMVAAWQLWANRSRQRIRAAEMLTNATVLRAYSRCVWTVSKWQHETKRLRVSKKVAAGLLSQQLVRAIRAWAFCAAARAKSATAAEIARGVVVRMLHRQLSA
eukprot:6722605-Prymnesium_polylepis.1